MNEHIDDFNTVQQVNNSILQHSENEDVISMAASRTEEETDIVLEPNHHVNRSHSTEICIEDNHSNNDSTLLETQSLATSNSPLSYESSPHSFDRHRSSIRMRRHSRLTSSNHSDVFFSSDDSSNTDEHIHLVSDSDTTHTNGTLAILSSQPSTSVGNSNILLEGLENNSQRRNDSVVQLTDVNEFSLAGWFFFQYNREVFVSPQDDMFASSSFLLPLLGTENEQQDDSIMVQTYRYGPLPESRHRRQPEDMISRPLTHHERTRPFHLLNNSQIDHNPKDCLWYKMLGFDNTKEAEMTVMSATPYHDASYHNLINNHSLAHSISQVSTQQLWECHQPLSVIHSKQVQIQQNNKQNSHYEKINVINQSPLMITDNLNLCQSQILLPNIPILYPVTPFSLNAIDIYQSCNALKTRCLSKNLTNDMSPDGQDLFVTAADVAEGNDPQGISWGRRPFVTVEATHTERFQRYNRDGFYPPIVVASREKRQKEISYFHNYYGIASCKTRLYHYWRTRRSAIFSPKSYHSQLRHLVCSIGTNEVLFVNNLADDELIRCGSLEMTSGQVSLIHGRQGNRFIAGITSLHSRYGLVATGFCDSRVTISDIGPNFNGLVWNHSCCKQNTLTYNLLNNSEFSDELHHQSYFKDESSTMSSTLFGKESQWDIVDTQLFDWMNYDHNILTPSPSLWKGKKILDLLKISDWEPEVVNHVAIESRVPLVFGGLNDDYFGLSNLNYPLLNTRPFDSLSLITACNDHTISEWTLDGRERWKVRFPWRTNHFSLSPEKKLICVGGDSRDIVILDRLSLRPALVLEGHYGFSFSASWHPDPQSYLLATGNQDCSCRLWDIRYPKHSLFVIGSACTGIDNVTFSPDGQTLSLLETNDVVCLYDVASHFNKYNIVNFFGKPVGQSFSPDSSRLFIGVCAPAIGGILELRKGEPLTHLISGNQHQSIKHPIDQDDHDVTLGHLDDPTASSSSSVLTMKNCNYTCSTIPSSSCTINSLISTTPSSVLTSEQMDQQYLSLFLQVFTKQEDIDFISPYLCLLNDSIINNKTIINSTITHESSKIASCHMNEPNNYHLKQQLYNMYHFFLYEKEDKLRQLVITELPTVLSLDFLTLPIGSIDFKQVLYQYIQDWGDIVHEVSNLPQYKNKSSLETLAKRMSTEISNDAIPIISQLSSICIPTQSSILESIETIIKMTQELNDLMHYSTIQLHNDEPHYRLALPSPATSFDDLLQAEGCATYVSLQSPTPSLTLLDLFVSATVLLFQNKLSSSKHAKRSVHQQSIIDKETFSGTTYPFNITLNILEHLEDGIFFRNWISNRIHTYCSSTSYTYHWLLCDRSVYNLLNVQMTNGNADELTNIPSVTAHIQLNTGISPMIELLHVYKTSKLFDLNQQFNVHHSQLIETYKSGNLFLLEQSELTQYPHLSHHKTISDESQNDIPLIFMDRTQFNRRQWDQIVPSQGSILLNNDLNRSHDLHTEQYIDWDPSYPFPIQPEEPPDHKRIILTQTLYNVKLHYLCKRLGIILPF